MYALYKPLRNYLRGFNLWSGLGSTYHYMQYLQFQQPLPEQLATPKMRLGASKMAIGIFEFNVEILIRELILNSRTNGGKSFNTAPLASKALEMIRKLEDAEWGNYRSRSEAIILHLSRLGFKQFPWQIPLTNGLLARYYILYSNPLVAPIVEAEFGMTVTELFQTTLLLTEELWKRPTPSFEFLEAAEQSVRAPVEALRDRISLSASELRDRTLRYQTYDVNWAYSFNPIREFPLIHAGNSRSILCPAPPILLQRLTDGLYFDLIRAAGGDFGNAIGRAFEDYVGNVAGSIGQNNLKVLSEAVWGKPEKRSIDWIISDKTAIQFVECKFARLNHASQTQISPEPAFKDAIQRLAHYVGQMYSTLADALNGQYPHWQPDSRPIYLILVTFNNWLAFGPFFYKHLDQSVSDEFTKRGLDRGLLETHPFTVCSIDEFEGLLTACCKHGINTVLKEKNGPNSRQSLMQGFLANHYAGCLSDAKKTFEDRMNSLIEGPSRITRL